MKKYLFAVLVAISVSSSAFATTYNCELPKDQQGHAIYGGPGYGIEVNQESVVLITRSGFPTPSTDEYVMSKINQEPDGSLFRSGNVTAAIFTSPIGGRLLTSVNISVELGSETYTAACK